MGKMEYFLKEFGKHNSKKEIFCEIIKNSMNWKHISRKGNIL
jgi:hypothetical protein